VDVAQGGTVGVGEGVEVAESVGERVGRGSEGAARDSVDEQVVGGDVEQFGRADYDVDEGVILPFSQRLSCPTSAPELQMMSFQHPP
jgi:hypothetical protein